MDALIATRDLPLLMDESSRVLVDSRHIVELCHVLLSGAVLEPLEVPLALLLLLAWDRLRSSGHIADFDRVSVGIVHNRLFVVDEVDLLVIVI